MERPFEFSSFPGRFATPLLGTAGALLVAVAGVWSTGGRARAAAILILAGVAVLIGTARWLTRHGVLTLPLLRERGVNLEAVRPGDTPRVWLCAHLDSKSQPVPTLARIAGLALETIGIASALLFAVTSLLGFSPDAIAWVAAGAVTLAGAVPVGLSMVGSRSPGALDNASGIATVVAAARRLDGRRGVGVLMTDAEELGLAGARAWTQNRIGHAVLNCDGVDDAGAVVVMRSAPAAGVTRAIRAAAAATGVRAAPRRLLPGLLVDSVAFADAGIESVTFSRGSLRSLTRVHTPRDDLSRLRGDGIVPTATLMAETARVLVGPDA